MSNSNAGPSSSVHKPSGSSSSAPSHQALEQASAQVFEPDTLPPAYIIEWTGDKWVPGTPLSTADSLGEALCKYRQANVPHLSVIRGLPASFIDVLDGVERGFLAAHVQRRRYRPRVETGGRTKQTRLGGRPAWAAFEYPELVTGWPGREKRPDEERDGKDLVRMPAPKPIRGKGDDDDGVAVIFCHASLWLGEREAYLFLDRPAWKNGLSPLQKAARPPIYRTEDGVLEVDTTFAEFDVYPDMEDALAGAFHHYDDLPERLEETAYDRWLDFFEVLTPEPQSDSPQETRDFYWHVVQSLEQNLDMSRELSRTEANPTAPTRPDWLELLSRAHRRINLLQQSMAAATSPPPSPVLKARVTGFAPLPTPHKPSRHPTFRSGGGKSSPSLPPSGPPDENQRGLDRISYLGGILIPFPIVSGILSMGDTFGPYGDKFYIFWAVSVPLAMLACLIIYADTIRKAEVWVEVAADTIAAVTPRISAPAPQAQAQTYTETVAVEKKTATWIRNGSASANGGGFVPQRAKYTLEEEEETVGIPAEAAPDALVYDAEEPEPGVIVQRRTDGSKPKAWKRQRLGWYGAAKAMVGVYKPVRAEDIPFAGPVYERPLRRKTRTL